MQGASELRIFPMPYPMELTSNAYGRKDAVFQLYPSKSAAAARSCDGGPVALADEQSIASLKSIRAMAL